MAMAVVSVVMFLFMAVIASVVMFPMRVIVVVLSMRVAVSIASPPEMIN